MTDADIFNIHIIMTVTAVVGSLVRITMEWDKHTLTISRAVFILAAGIAVSFLFYYANDYKQWIPSKYIAFPSIISGIIATDIVKFGIDYIPKLLKKKADNI